MLNCYSQNYASIIGASYYWKQSACRFPSFSAIEPITHHKKSNLEHMDNFHYKHDKKHREIHNMCNHELAPTLLVKEMEDKGKSMMCALCMCILLCPKGTIGSIKVQKPNQYPWWLSTFTCLTASSRQVGMQLKFC